MALCSSDWMKINTGNLVREKGGRHEARVEAVHHGAVVRVTFIDTGWIAFYSLDEIERVPHLELVKG